MKAFIREKYAEVHTVISVCSGIFALARSGVLAGHQVTATRILLPLLRSEFSSEFTITEKRWEVDLSKTKKSQSQSQGDHDDDGKKEGPELWTAGGVVNGNDIVYAYLKTRFPSEVTKIISDVAEVADRSQEY